MDKDNPTQFGRAMEQLGIQMIPAYSPEARGRSERMFRTLQDRLVKELAMAEIDTMEAANEFLNNDYLPAFNTRFMVEPASSGDAFVPLLGIALDDILCVKAERIVNNDNCVSYRGKVLQIPKMQDRPHYVKARVQVHEYADGSLSVFHGPRKLAKYDSEATRNEEEMILKERPRNPARDGAPLLSPSGLRPPGLSRGEKKKRTIYVL